MTRWLCMELVLCAKNGYMFCMLTGEVGCYAGLSYDGAVVRICGAITSHMLICYYYMVTGVLGSDVLG